MVKKVMKIKPCKNNIGAEINIDLLTTSKKDVYEIQKVLDEFGVIFFRNQNLDPQSYINFAKNFGELADYPMLKGLSKEFSKITVIERKSSDKGPSFGEQFHTDSSYTKKPPRYTMLLGKLVPPRGQGNTDFASQYLAYKNLPEKIKIELENLRAVFSSSGPISVTRLEREKEKGTGKSKDFQCSHKIIQKVNNRKTIYFSPGHVIGIKGVDPKKSRDLLDFLINHQTKAEFVYSFEWEKNSIAMWDNRAILHQATAYTGDRIMHRITIQ